MTQDEFKTSIAELRKTLLKYRLKPIGSDNHIKLLYEALLILCNDLIKLNTKGE